MPINDTSRKFALNLMNKVPRQDDGRAAAEKIAKNKQMEEKEKERQKVSVMQPGQRAIASDGGSVVKRECLGTKMMVPLLRKPQNGHTFSRRGRRYYISNMLSQEIRFMRIRSAMWPFPVASLRTTVRVTE